MTTPSVCVKVGRPDSGRHQWTRKLSQQNPEAISASNCKIPNLTPAARTSKRARRQPPALDQLLLWTSGACSTPLSREARKLIKAYGLQQLTPYSNRARRRADQIRGFGSFHRASTRKSLPVDYILREMATHGLNRRSVRRWTKSFHQAVSALVGTMMWRPSVVASGSPPRRIGALGYVQGAFGEKRDFRPRPGSCAVSPTG